MKKISTLKDYCYGTLAYSNFLFSFLSGEVSDKSILEKDVANAAKVGLISNVFFSIKEDVIENIGNLEYESKVSKIRLYEASKEILTFNNNIPEINGYKFKSIEEFIQTLRNRLAHGNFLLDASHSRVILLVDGKEIIININKLVNFVLSLSEIFLDELSERTIVLQSEKSSDSSNSLSTQEDIYKFLKSMEIFHFKITSKDGSEPDKNIKDKTNDVYTSYISSRDPQILYSYQQEVKDSYNFEWETRRLTTSEIDELSKSLVSLIPNNLKRAQKEELIRQLVNNRMNEGQKSNLIKSSVTNLMLLTTAYKNGTVNEKALSTALKKEMYKNVSVSYEEILSANIAVFNSFFSYGNDSFLNNKNEYTLEPNTGLDYSLLDLSLLNVEKYTIDEGPIQNLQEQVTAKSKRVKEKEESINKAKSEYNNIVNLGKPNVEKIILQKLQNLGNHYNTLIQEENALASQLQIAQTYKQNNEKHLINRAIINGIRNSIAHGHYYLVSNENPINTLIVFEDIYEGSTTFKATITLFDFMDLLKMNIDVIVNFADLFVEKEDQQKL